MPGLGGGGPTNSGNARILGTFGTSTPPQERGHNLMIFFLLLSSYFLYIYVVWNLIDCVVEILNDCCSIGTMIRV